jgi:hypothetical protein
MSLDLFLGLVFLLLWLVAEAVCIWLILKDRKEPTCYGYAVGAGGTNRVGTPAEPNFYKRSNMNSGKQ